MKEVGQNMNKATKGVIIISIIVLVLFLGYKALTVYEYNSHTPLEFTPEAWNEHIWQRERMLDSLKSKYDLGSMKYDQIVELLGTNGIADGSGKSRMTYYTGKSTAIPQFLSIDFDEDGNVAAIMISTRSD